MLTKIGKQVKGNWLFLTILIALSILVLLVGVFYNKRYEEKVLKEYQNQLTILAELKSTQITLWRQERILDGQIIQTDQGFAQYLDLYIHNPLDLYVIKRIQDRMQTFLFNPNYRSIFLVDDHGNALLHVGNMEDHPGEDLLQYVDVKGASPEIQLSDLWMTPQGSTNLELIVPILTATPQDSGSKVFLVFLINPEIVFYPLIQSYPASLATAETLLIRKEGNSVLFLNQLRYHPNSALRLKIPLSETEVPAVKAGLGQTGTVKGVDYRGVATMAVILPIENTEWKIIAKMDQKEIFQSINYTRALTAITIIFILVSASFLIAAAWRSQSASILRGLSASETERKKLQTKYETLFNQANDAILLIKKDGKIVEANDRAVELYGYAKDELLSMSVFDLRATSAKQDVRADMDNVKDGRINSFETHHRSKNGENILVEVSSRYVSFEGEGFFQSLIRDITARKKAEDDLRQSELALKKAQQISHVGSWHFDVPQRKVYFSDEIFRIFDIPLQSGGFDFEKIVKKISHPDDIERVIRENADAIQKKRKYSFETRILRPDGSERIVWVEAGEVNVDENQNVVSISGIIQDITEKKIAERSIRKNEALLQRIIEILPVGLWITDRQGTMIQSNKMVKEIWGEDILVGIDEFEVFHGRRLPSREEIQPDDWASVHTIREGVTIRDEMIEIDAHDGKTKTILNYSTPIFGENGELEGSVIMNLDITELRQAEQRLSEQLDELRRWNKATLGREDRIRELKVEINRLLTALAKPPRYKSVVDDTHE